MEDNDKILSRRYVRCAQSKPDQIPRRRAMLQGRRTLEKSVGIGQAVRQESFRL
jgi:hypothetical protein